jgi:hypothetical protein
MHWVATLACRFSGLSQSWHNDCVSYGCHSGFWFYKNEKAPVCQLSCLEEELMNVFNRKKNLFRIAIFGMLIALALPVTALGQRRGRGRNRDFGQFDKKCAKFVNCHDARDGRWDGHGRRRNLGIFRNGIFFPRGRGRDFDDEHFFRQRRFRQRNRGFDNDDDFFRQQRFRHRDRDFDDDDFFRQRRFRQRNRDFDGDDGSFRQRRFRQRNRDFDDNDGSFRRGRGGRGLASILNNIFLP